MAALKERKYSGAINLETNPSKVPKHLLPSLEKWLSETAGYFAKKVSE